LVSEDDPNFPENGNWVDFAARWDR
jgi:hypothetical protein